MPTIFRPARRSCMCSRTAPAPKLWSNWLDAGQRMIGRRPFTIAIRGRRDDRESGDEIERHLSVRQVAELLGTTERFPRRLIAERRIRFVRVGRHFRIPESAVRDLLAAGLVEAARPSGVPRRVA